METNICQSAVSKKTWEDYDPKSMQHLVVSSKGDVLYSALQKGDILLLCDTGIIDLVEVRAVLLKKMVIQVWCYSEFGTLINEKACPELFSFSFDPLKYPERVVRGVKVRSMPKLIVLSEDQLRAHRSKAAHI